MKRYELIAKYVNLIYSACGRQTNQAILEAYEIALEDRTDYQIMLAAQSELQSPGEFPINAGGLRALAGNYPRSPEHEQQQLAEQREAAKRLPPPSKQLREAVRTAMAEALDAIKERGGEAAEFATEVENHRPRFARKANRSNLTQEERGRINREYLQKLADGEVQVS